MRGIEKAFEFMCARPFYSHFGDSRSHVYTMEWQYLLHALQVYFVSGAQDLQIIRHRPTLLLLSETACTVG